MDDLKRKIELILLWAEESERAQDMGFDASFVEKMSDKVNRLCQELTPNQIGAIENIYNKFNVEDWADESGYA